MIGTTEEFRPWCDYQADLPMLREINSAKVLVRSPTSSVDRLTLKTGDSVIAKLATDINGKEIQAYRDVVNHLPFRTPNLIDSLETKDVQILVIEDVGKTCIRKIPLPVHFYSAVSILVEIHKTGPGSDNNPKLSSDLIHRYKNSGRELLDMLEYIDKNPLDNDPWEINDEIAVLKPLLLALDNENQRHIIHNDFHSKNLILNEDILVPIDWGHVKIGSHLADVFCIVMEGASFGVNIKKMVQHYMENMSLVDYDEVDQKVKIGGACFYIFWMYNAMRCGDIQSKRIRDTLKSSVLDIKRISRALAAGTNLESLLLLR